MFIILIGVLIILLIFSIVVWVSCDYDSAVLVLPVGLFLGCILLVGFMFSSSGSNAAEETRVRVESTYNRLMQVIDSRIEIDADLLKEIYDYNEGISVNRAHQNNWFYWGAMPKIYDEFELIDISKLEEKISDADSSIRVVMG